MILGLAMIVIQAIFFGAVLGIVIGELVIPAFEWVINMFESYANNC